MRTAANAIQGAVRGDDWQRRVSDADHAPDAWDNVYEGAEGTARAADICLDSAVKVEVEAGA